MEELLEYELDVLTEAMIGKHDIQVNEPAMESLIDTIGSLIRKMCDWLGAFIALIGKTISNAMESFRDSRNTIYYNDKKMLASDIIFHIDSLSESKNDYKALHKQLEDLKMPPDLLSAFKVSDIGDALESVCDALDDLEENPGKPASANATKLKASFGVSDKTVYDIPELGGTTGDDILIVARRIKKVIANWNSVNTSSEYRESKI